MEEASCSFTKNDQDNCQENKNQEDSCDNNTEDKSETIQDPNDFSLPNIPEDYKVTYEEYVNKIKALASRPIYESVSSEHIKNFKHFNLRYYEDKYSVNFFNAETGHSDVLIRIHSNKLFLVSLASGNDIVRCGKKIIGINFMINNSDRSEIKLGGKRKKGAKPIEPHTILCQVKCEGILKMFNIRAGIPGRILEINEHVKTDPDLLRTDPKGYGYLAIVAPKGHPSDYEKVLNNLKLLSEKEYLKYFTETTPTFSELSKEMLLESKS